MKRYLFGITLLFLFNRTGAEGLPPEGMTIRTGLAVSSVSRAGRSVFHTDPIEAALVAGQWHSPHAGESITLPDGRTREWESATAGEDGLFPGNATRGGYLYAPVVMDAPQVALLTATGHSLTYVNGEPRTGDLYQWNIVTLPVKLHAGTNDFLFLSGRGRIRADLKPPKAPVSFHLSDLTLPDIIEGQRGNLWGAVILINATTNSISGAAIRAGADGHTRETPVPEIPPLSTRKIPFQVYHSGRSKTNQVPVKLELFTSVTGKRQLTDTATINLRFRAPDQTFKATFISDTDGSLQYYGVRPAVPVTKRNEPLALFLSLHGASVEAIGQVDAYSPKSWGVIAAPTNRRPYGFDWEDWGRHDAIEVLELAQARFHTDPRRTYLTGHSMGGHGTWQVGATFPDRFAALGPSAGWISFWSYRGAQRETNPDPIQALFERATNPSDTLALSTNYLHHGIYILHGDKDDNVPVGQARLMREQLEKFHHDYSWHEQPGAGHWWDSSDEPGAECMDWPAMYDLFARHELRVPEEIREVNFTTANPGISARCDWLTIYAQQHALAMSTASLRFDPGRRRFTGTTVNVERMALDATIIRPGGPVTVELDSQTFTNINLASGRKNIWLLRNGDGWQISDAPSPGEKGPHRYGPFKEAFAHRMVFVYGTRGLPEENAWAFVKARYDAENFWYRGNGAVDVMPDTAFDPARERDRGVVIYGNADSNGAWHKLLGDSPVQLRRGGVTVDGREVRGDNLACLFLRPRPDSDVASVAVVGGTGIAGMKLTDRMPYFVSGVAFPDYAVFGPETLVDGYAGVRVAGFFGNDWTVKRGEAAWRE